MEVHGDTSLFDGLKLDIGGMSRQRSIMAVEEAEQALTDLFASRSSNAVDATAGEPAGAMPQCYSIPLNQCL